MATHSSAHACSTRLPVRRRACASFRSSICGANCTPPHRGLRQLNAVRVCGGACWRCADAIGSEPMSTTSDLQVQYAAGIATVTFNRPAVKNALTFGMCRELIAVLERLRSDASTRVLLLRGAGSDFSSGADLKEVSTIVAPDPLARSAAATAQVRELSMPLFQALETVPQPVVCSV